MSTSTRNPIESLRDMENSRIGLYVVLLFGIVFYLFPMETAVMTMFKTQTEFVETVPFAPPSPDGFTLGALMTAWNTLRPGLVNSMLMAIPATIFSAMAGSLAAYGLTTISWRGQVAVFSIVLAGIFIPYQAVLVPLAQFWYQILPDLMNGFVNTAFGFITGGNWTYPTRSGHVQLLQLSITHAAYGTPMCTLLFRSYYKGISDEMIEAARLDGATAFSIYKNIILPLSLPMFAVTLIYQFTQVYNDLLFALVLVNEPASQVATQRLAALTGGVVQSFNTTMAGAIVAALPTLLVYIFFGEQFAKGVAE
ncbi:MULTISPECIES: carbohydrate ABC transporter permease [Haloarcula]|uniref:Sugar ABC transporter permease n=1 Tax=Haloarcula pellucida TaxID=1427151 RepID=A0A830GIS8_9EURY|nr:MULTISPECIES: carbohydrate ABC transporter permease [Halomicroarcula]MBX0347093.1 carbohydrate ABC transporter permease [Halomicroarcula pellucida]MDS0277032.1 carbohydrate ABC transporter permease [Halomicroarcula sp. S1AR25-4]GGN86960.1 sugar ABC transporter permease [Halomicroarcula pellucida]